MPDADISYWTDAVTRQKYGGNMPMVKGNPYTVVKDFEAALSEYTGASYVVTTNSCTNALFLSLLYCGSLKGLDAVEISMTVEIPKRTYVSVPMQIIHAGEGVTFRDEDWQGEYRLIPHPIWDSARRFTSGMYRPGSFQCVSFHASKILGLEHGGAILHDNPRADGWFRKARFDGRTEGVAVRDDEFDTLGYHCHMAPSVAALGLLKLHSLPRHNEDLLRDDYPDLSKMAIFR